MIERRFLSPAHARRHALTRFLYREGDGVVGAGEEGDGGRPPRPRDDSLALRVFAAAARRALESVGEAFGYALELRSSATHTARVGLDRPVLCVGGVGVGGSGKTPFVRWLGQRLLESGRTPAVLTRGYGWMRRSDAPVVLLPGVTAGAYATSRLPDEAVLFVRDGLPVGAHPDRGRSAVALVRAGVRPDAYLMDDGFQHRWLGRTWDLVLVSLRDLSAPRRPFPGGPLRERWSALARADRIAITGLDATGARALAERGNAQLGLPPGDPPLQAGLEWAGMLPFEAWHGHAGIWSHDPPDLEGLPPELPRSFLAFSGIADPGSFERLLASSGLPVPAHVVFPDHHRYSPVELARLIRLLPADGALATTEKDAARLEPGWLPPRTCWVVRARLRLWRGEGALRAELDRLVPREV